MGHAEDCRRSSQFNSFFILSFFHFIIYDEFCAIHGYIYAAHYEPTVETTRWLRRFDMPKRFRKEHCLSVFMLSHRDYSFFTPRSRHSWFSLKYVHMEYVYMHICFHKKKTISAKRPRADHTVLIIMNFTLSTMVWKIFQFFRSTHSNVFSTGDQQIKFWP